MSDVCRVEKQIGGRTLSIETGKVAKQADGAVVVQYGETVVLVTAVVAEPREGIDFFPLSVDYREKQSAAGKFPGGFIKREGRPSTKEILTARMIDRPIRPLFPERYFQEIQIMASVLSADQENDPDVLAMIGASAALTISRIPFLGPMGACRLGRVNGEFVVNPTHKQLADSDLSLLLGGHKDALNMIEVGAGELSEKVIADAVATAHKVVGEVCELIEQLHEKAGVEKETPLLEFDEQLYSQMHSQIADKLYELKQIPAKQPRCIGVDELFEQIASQYCPDEPVLAVAATGSPEGVPGTTPKFDKAMVKRIFGKIEGQVVRKMLLEGKRCDGRRYDELRPISSEVGVWPRTHGSAIFTRGETQAIVSITLGTIRDAQIIDGLLEEYAQNFTVHYNFPPFSVGEIRPQRGPGRREIGHGALAERALERVRPADDKFAYTVRIITDTTFD
ncbi:Polyribonucleotide nucleotidyltransferase [subsurface metagenome]